MSHTTTIDLAIKDEACFIEACKDLGYPVTQNTSVKLFQQGSNFENVTSVNVPGWRYPVVVDNGQVHFDNYNGKWGSIEGLNKLKQRYARNVAVKEARKKGYRVREKQEENGRIKLVLTR